MQCIRYSSLTCVNEFTPMTGHRAERRTIRSETIFGYFYLIKALFVLKKMKFLCLELLVKTARLER